MALDIQNLDLEEQEQLAKLKAFWEAWGNLIMGVLIVSLLSFSAWRGYDWYTSRQAMQACMLLDQMQADAQSADMARLASSLQTMQKDFARTTCAQQAQLLAGKVFFEKGKPDEARAALQAAAHSSADKGLRSLARLQLASLLLQQKDYDAALEQVSAGIEPAFAALAAERMGDIYWLKGDSARAAQFMQQAYEALDPNLSYRHMVAVKLNALGVDVEALGRTAPAAQPQASGAAAPASAS